MMRRFPLRDNKPRVPRSPCDEINYTDSRRVAEIVAKANANVPLSDYEIAELLGVTRTRVWQLRERAEQRLRVELAEFI
jgi:DNA-directed RNA polymerase sigma subunit (sigma70/sigma32)